jgi:hypothetical protein
MKLKLVFSSVTIDVSDADFENLSEMMAFVEGARFAQLSPTICINLDNVLAIEAVDEN